ncbi:S8 family serine peptidase, partial [Acinetobacter baumannii]
HEDLAANIVAGYNFVNNNSDPTPASSTETHGTSVAGCVAAVGNNGIGVSGAAWNEKIMPLKFGFDVASEVRAFEYARDHGAKVVNA